MFNGKQVECLVGAGIEEMKKGKTMTFGKGKKAYRFRFPSDHDRFEPHLMCYTDDGYWKPCVMPNRGYFDKYWREVKLED